MSARGGLTETDCQHFLEQVPGVVLVKVRTDYQRAQVWLHVRGGKREDVMRMVAELEELKPAAVHFQVDHAEPEPHHYVLRDAPWVQMKLIG